MATAEAAAAPVIIVLLLLPFVIVENENDVHVARRPEKEPRKWKLGS